MYARPDILADYTKYAVLAITLHHFSSINLLPKLVSLSFFFIYLLLLLLLPRVLINSVFVALRTVCTLNLFGVAKKKSKWEKNAQRNELPKTYRRMNECATKQQ